MRKTKKLTVPTSEGPADITLVQMDGMTAGLMAPKIAGLVAPVVASAFADKEKRNYKDLGDAVKVACAELSSGEFESLVTRLFAGGQAKVKGAQLDLDRVFIEEYFNGNVDSLFKALLAALELNFSAFFEPLRKTVAGVTQRMATTTPTPTDSSGQPND